MSYLSLNILMIATKSVGAGRTKNIPADTPQIDRNISISRARSHYTIEATTTDR
jgi:hypothetical protein